MNENKQENSDSEVDENQPKLSFIQVIGSVFAAAFGVQSNKNRQRDFTQAKPSTYVIAGIIFTALFVLTISAVVALVLNTASS